MEFLADRLITENAPSLYSNSATDHVRAIILKLGLINPTRFPYS